MTDQDFLIWAGMRLSDQMQGEGRKVFLRLLRDDLDGACLQYSVDPDRLSVTYAIAQQKAVLISAEGGEDIVTSLTRQIFTYFRDELAAKEIAALPT